MNWLKLIGKQTPEADISKIAKWIATYACYHADSWSTFIDINELSVFGKDQKWWNKHCDDISKAMEETEFFEHEADMVSIERDKHKNFDGFMVYVFPGKCYHCNDILSSTEEDE